MVAAGAATADEPMPIVLITCSGLSNVGRLTEQVGRQILTRRPGRVEWVRAQAGPKAIADAVAEASCVFVLDGCKDCCGSKKADEAGVKPSIRLMATKLGIVKDSRAEVRYDEIEAIQNATDLL